MGILSEIDGSRMENATTGMLRTIVLAQPRGFCAGVDRAVEIVELAVEAYGAPIYCRREIVHNKHVVRMLVEKGVVFIEELAEAPDGATVVFSAHGVAPDVWTDAKTRGLRVIDATCPLVTKVHLEVRHFARKGFTILYIGHRLHEEVVGVRGEAPGAVLLVESEAAAEAVAPPDPDRVACLTQTTLSVDETAGISAVLRRRFPRMVTPPKSDICYATQNRQEAVKALAREVQLVLVIGSTNSSNSNRLVDVARSCGVAAHLIHDADEIQTAWMDGVRAVGITSGASTPDVLVERVVESLSSGGDVRVETLSVAQENVTFGLPRELLPFRRP
jgi:4-hydroxy-3-methylbut-2-en-1-yl diphosphate reductase